MSTRDSEEGNKQLHENCFRFFSEFVYIPFDFKKLRVVFFCLPTDNVYGAVCKRRRLIASENSANARCSEKAQKSLHSGENVQSSTFNRCHLNATREMFVSKRATRCTNRPGIEKCFPPFLFCLRFEYTSGRNLKKSISLLEFLILFGWKRKKHR